MGDVASPYLSITLGTRLASGYPSRMTSQIKKWLFSLIRIRTSSSFASSVEHKWLDWFAELSEYAGDAIVAAEFEEEDEQYLEFKEFESGYECVI
ncbi:hypothetical protein L6452_18158 [Arctium lappa]|uniref:Uncharacterized protein n=1 Tax=Arctium lappa TaxID=4217 RepID=A0ACB9C5R3_ARCLA|nr:hypothetical protein L6452_18158 [Arctium lappa]